jgi:sugar lactone lactonase YvrE
LTRTTVAVLVVALASAVPAPAEDDSFVRDARRHLQEALAARKAGRAQAALESFLQAAALRPHHPGLAFELGAAYAAAGRFEEAAATFRRVAAMGIPFKPEGRDDLRACRAHAACAEALAAVESAGAPRARSTVALTFPGPGLVPEGLAYDPRTRAFFVSSVRERRILRVDPSGPPRAFADRASLWSAMGLGVDAERRRLWVATSALAETAGLSAGEEGRAALVGFDLEDGRVVARLELPAGRRHVLGDLVVTPTGEVWATDSASPAVYRLGLGAAGLETLVAGEPFVSPQGIALSLDGAIVYVADYAKGVFAVEAATRRVRLLDAPADAALLGIDGLYTEGPGALLAVQNGTAPARLLRLRLEGPRITAVEAVDVGHPKMAEPTLGTFADGRFHYIANSQWDALQKGGAMKEGVALQDPVILGLDLSR